MMDVHAMALMVQAFAVNARVAGMVAENQHRLDCGNSIAYGVEAFEAEASTLDYLAEALRSRAG